MGFLARSFPDVCQGKLQLSMENGANSTTFQNYTQNVHRIYVMGHGSPGSSYITTETGTYEQCYTHELAVMFRDHGLPLNSAAHIRMHVCNSGTPSTGGARDSFAEVFKLDMAALGYNHVTVRGYDCKVGVYLGWRWGGWEPANDHAIDF